MEGHCIRNPELLASDLVYARQSRARPTKTKLLVYVTEGSWEKLYRGTANPDAGQGYIEGVIWRRWDLVPTQLQYKQQQYHGYEVKVTNAYLNA